MMLDTAVIPCGGRGTPLHPITRWLLDAAARSCEGPLELEPDNLFQRANEVGVPEGYRDAVATFPSRV